MFTKCSYASFTAYYYFLFTLLRIEYVSLSVTRHYRYYCYYYHNLDEIKKTVFPFTFPKIRDSNNFLINVISRLTDSFFFFLLNLITKYNIFLS